MNEKEVPPAPINRLRSLKQKIHDNEEKIGDALGPEQSARLYEALFGDLRAWIKSEGTSEEIRAMEPIVKDFGLTKREEIIDTPSSLDYKSTMIYSIENDESTEKEVYLQIAAETKAEMLLLVWRRLEEKRIMQYQSLKEIFGRMFKGDEIIHDKTATPDRVRDRIRQRREKDEIMG